MRLPPNPKRRSLLGGGLAMVAATQSTLAQPAFPSKAMKMVTGFPAGSATDSIARPLAEYLRTKFGQPVVVENRAGANGSLGVVEVVRAPADGYTILVTNSSSITVNPQLYKRPGYLPERDLIPLSMVVSAPFILVVNPEAERTASVRNVGDLVALAKAKPGTLTYGSGGLGNLAHLAFEMINNRAGIRTNHVPYKSGFNAQMAVMGKEIDTMLDTPQTLPNIKSGKLRPLAVSTATRWSELPDVPTMAESGFPGFDVSFWLGLLLPANTPPAVVQTLYAAVRSSREDANTARLLSAQGRLELTDPQTFAARVKAETAAWGEVIKRENISLD